MNTKTFKAPTAKEALSRVSRELGPDAIIISQKKGRDSGGNLWVEVIAAPLDTGDSAPEAAPTIWQFILKNKVFIVAGLSSLIVIALLIVGAVAFWPRAEQTTSTGQEENTTALNEAQPIADLKRIAVLPFENLGPAENDYFADALSDEISISLAGLSSIEVIARESTSQYKSTDKSLDKIGRELGVQYILCGTISRQKNSGGISIIRVRPRLVRVSDTTNVWADTYEEEMSDTFKLLSNISARVADGMNISMIESDYKSLEEHPTNNIDAYNFYIRGKEYKARVECTLAAQMFEKAVSLDPSFAKAWAELSSAYSDLYNSRIERTEEMKNKAKHAVDRAFELTPDLPEAYLAMGSYLNYYADDKDKALDYLRIALQRMKDKSPVYVSLGSIYRALGDYEKALGYFHRAFELSPRVSKRAWDISNCYCNLRNYKEAEKYNNIALEIAPDAIRPYQYGQEMYLAWKGDIAKARELNAAIVKQNPHFKNYGYYREYCFLLLERKFDEAMKQIDKIDLEVFQGAYQYYPLDLLYGHAFYFLNQTEKSREHYEKASEILSAHVKENPEDERIYISRGLALAGLGEKEQAISIGKRAISILEKKRIFSTAYTRMQYDLAWLYVISGEKDPAVDILESLLNRPSEISTINLKMDPRWDPLRGNPRFQKLIEEH
jgi:TolB-like protein/Tfp pilus assembly protein PilF